MNESPSRFYLRDCLFFALATLQVLIRLRRPTGFLEGEKFPDNAGLFEMNFFPSHCRSTGILRRVVEAINRDQPLASYLLWKCELEPFRFFCHCFWCAIPHLLPINAMPEQGAPMHCEMLSTTAIRPYNSASKSAEMLAFQNYSPAKRASHAC